MPGVQHLPFFYRRRVEFDDVENAGFLPAGYPEIDGYLFRPVEAGLWRQHETSDETYTFGDLMDAHELLDVRARNEIDFKAWGRKQQEG